jgi:lipoprotein NlpD
MPVPAEPAVALQPAPAVATVIPKPVAATPLKPAEPEPKLAPTRPADTGSVVWHWPSNGKVISNFAAGDMLKTGIDIAGNAGDPVLAAADGEVVYSGNGLIGYGELVIVKHNDSFLSAYGHNRKRLVQEHERVRAGQPIAEMGSSSAARDELHFEIRKNGKPVNPMDYLPGR